MEFTTTETESEVIIRHMLNIELHSTYVFIYNSIVETNSTFLARTVREVYELPATFKRVSCFDILCDVRV